MSPEQIAARLAIRVALTQFHESRRQLGVATLALRKIVDMEPKLPAFLRPQIG